MTSLSKRCTIYLEPDLHETLRLKAATARRSASEIVNDALRLALREDLEDLAAFDERDSEPSVSNEDLLRDLRANGRHP